MNDDLINKIITLADRVDQVFLATADKEGVPHITTVNSLLEIVNGVLFITHWFCSQTAVNLSVNRNVAILVWDNLSDEGYLVTGVSESFLEAGIIDGHAPHEENSSVPQVLYTMEIRIKKVLRFARAAHSEKEL